MSPFLWLGLSAVAAFLTCFASLGNKILTQFSPHELEQFCRRKQRLSLFDTILEEHEGSSLAAESLRVIGVTLFLVFGCWGYIDFLIQEGHSAGKGLYETGEEERWAVLRMVGLLGALLLVFNTWVPWALVRVTPVSVLYYTWPFWRVNYWLMWPLVAGVAVCDSFLKRLAGYNDEAIDEEEAFEDDVLSIVSAGEREGFLEKETRNMIEGVMELGDADVSDVMMPRSKIDAIDINSHWVKVVQAAIESGRTRLPVFEENLDHVVGVLYVKDLLAELANPEKKSPELLRKLLRQPWFIPATKPLNEQLRDFLKTRTHMAIIVDEYQTVVGVVTIEDVLEEIVGEIVDESDKEEEADIRQITEKQFEIDAQIHIDEVNQQLGLNLPISEQYDSVSGMLVTHWKRIPQEGEEVKIGTVHFTVIEATARCVVRVRIEL
ncbi:MAG: hemolysin family protein [Pirellulaceae bacterium]|nr:hemolysin family protein [Pirellulaceae bacterium]